MKRSPWPLVMMTVLLTLAWGGARGTAPRSAASQYPAHAEQAGKIGIGARLLTRTEVRKTFVSDLNHCCVVVELAVFPQNEQPFAVALSDIAVRMAGSDTATKPATAAVLAAALQHGAQQSRDVTISPESSIGYESGSVYDPARGTNVRTHGVYTSTGVGVGIGQRGDQPGATDQDRAVMETELGEKGLPEGSIKSPVAGYVYFQLSPKKNAKYQLLYTVNGQQLSLAIQ